MFRLLAAAAMTAAFIYPAQAGQIAYITAPQVDAARARELVFKHVDAAPKSLRDAIGDMPFYVFNSQASYKTEGAAKGLGISVKDVMGTSPTSWAISWVPVDCRSTTYRRSISFFLDKIESSDADYRKHVVLHEMMHQIDSVTCFSESKAFADAHQADAAIFRAYVDNLSKTDEKGAKAFQDKFGYYIADQSEAYAEVGAYLIEMPKNKDYRELFFKIFAKTWQCPPSALIGQNGRIE
jgi:predicted Zn-dependent protease with MMP-like domain